MVRWQIIQSFVARIWLERNADEDPRWRGHIQHVQGPEETYFQDLTEMSEFMEQVSSMPSLEVTSQPSEVIPISEHSTNTGKKGVTDK